MQKSKRWVVTGVLGIAALGVAGCSAGTSNASLGPALVMDRNIANPPSESGESSGKKSADVKKDAPKSANTAVTAAEAKTDSSSSKRVAAPKPKATSGNSPNSANSG